MKYTIANGCVECVKDNIPMYTPILIDDKTGLEYFDLDNFYDAELDLVGDELLSDNKTTLSEHYEQVKELTK